MNNERVDTQKIVNMPEFQNQEMMLQFTKEMFQNGNLRDHESEEMGFFITYGYPRLARDLTSLVCELTKNFLIKNKTTVNYPR